MTAYLFVTITVRDTTWVEAYRANVPGILQKHGGTFVAASEHIRRYEGEGADPDRAVLMAFPTMAAIDAFVSDPEYRPYREKRLAASSGDAFAFSSGED